MTRLLFPTALVSLVLSAAIFGFFYAWVCSTMWGLDTLAPGVAVQAMQAMNASVRNAVFAPAFFATPFVLLLTAGMAWASARRAALFFGLGGLLYLGGGMILTMVVNVPMNEALAQFDAPLPPDQAAQIWQDYSPRWQRFNVIRTLASGATVLLCGLGLHALGRKAPLDA